MLNAKLLCGLRFSGVKSESIPLARALGLGSNILNPSALPQMLITLRQDG